jgi:hypothetical protein
MDRKVVVLVSIKIAKRSDGQMFAAHIPELGLTAYGRTEEEARQAVKSQFNRFINKYRELGSGLLEKRLNQVKATWFWEDQYPSTNDLPPIEYTNTDHEPASKARPKHDWTSIDELGLAA